MTTSPSGLRRAFLAAERNPLLLNGLVAALAFITVSYVNVSRVITSPVAHPASSDWILGMAGLALFAVGYALHSLKGAWPVLILIAGLCLALPASRYGGLGIVLIPQTYWVVYVLGRDGDRREWRLAGGLVVAAALTWGALFHSGMPIHPRGALIGLLPGALILALGILRKQTFQSRAALMDKVKRLEKEAQQERQLAASAERARIAREMHDIVAHSLAVIATQSEGGRMALRQDTERAAAAFEEISGTARSALDEMRHILGVLRAENSDEQGADDAAPQRSAPTLDDLPALIASSNALDSPDAFTVTGRDRREKLSPGAQLVLYRGAQEMLTNALKHGGSDPQTEMALDWTDEDVTLTCRNRRSDAEHRSRSAASPGLGLQGMRERAGLYEGRVETAETDRAFAVSLSLPLTLPSSQGRAS